jgi:hypothetical protein
MTQPSPYLALHDRVASIYSLINDGRYFYRRPEESPLVRDLFALKQHTVTMDRDRVVASLANKALNTHKAIAVLCGSGLADDAYALCRILMENFANLAWICKGDWIKRIDRYGLFIAPTRRRLMKVLVEHFPDSIVAKEALAAWEREPSSAVISKELFRDSHLKWAHFDPPKHKKEGALKAMMRELDPEHVAPESGNFAYALSYFDCSHFVHSNPLSLRNIDREVMSEHTYSIRARPRHELTNLALILSITWTLTILTALNEFLGATFEPDIEAAAAELKELAKEA